MFKGVCCNLHMKNKTQMRTRHGAKRLNTITSAEKRGVTFPPNEDTQVANESSPQPAEPVIQVNAVARSKKALVQWEWRKEDMDSTLKDVEDNEMSTRSAAKKWGIRTTTLNNWLGGLTTTSKKGPPTVKRL